MIRYIAKVTRPMVMDGRKPIEKIHNAVCNFYLLQALAWTYQRMLPLLLMSSKPVRTLNIHFCTRPQLEKPNQSSLRIHCSHLHSCIGYICHHDTPNQCCLLKLFLPRYQGKMLRCTKWRYYNVPIEVPFTSLSISNSVTLVDIRRIKRTRLLSVYNISHSRIHTLMRSITAFVFQSGKTKKK